MSRKTEIAKAKVRKIVKLLRSVKCDNFRVVGIGQWGSPTSGRIPK